jgi:hypothetical protein
MVVGRLASCWRYLVGGDGSFKAGSMHVGDARRIAAGFLDLHVSDNIPQVYHEVIDKPSPG